ncbi:Rieske 2Fe-2S domain-containing protein [Phenylobacterium sp.]|jgi:nitrite reductase/ring-hydroxylating ferredoxin subunit|uniref:Rieske 2Fe-2S domain-containing protein n=1 Tax=Phenylobacterium sp. TaxID=1871053 RepID=UPI002F42077F
MSQAPTARERGYDLPLPFGWFAVAMSDEVAAGQVRTLKYFGAELVLWRGEDGGLNALDPYCRHLGAHLGYGGQVVGNDLRCPFHHWRYDGAGGVTDIPYARVVPPRLKTSCVPAWPVQESLGVVYVWRHPHKAEPMWELATIPELSEENWVRTEQHEWIVKIHIQEITENGMDYAHFRAVHGTKSPPTPEYHMEGYSRRSSVATKMETPRGLVDGRIEVRAIGPGQSFTRFYGISDVVLSQQQTAIDSATVHIRQQFYHPQDISEGRMRVTKAQIRNLVFQIEQDIPIWEHKRFEPSPMLVEGDGPILSYRQQYARYYADLPKAPAEA